MQGLINPVLLYQLLSSNFEISSSCGCGLVAHSCATLSKNLEPHVYYSLLDMVKMGPNNRANAIANNNKHLSVPITLA